MAPDPMVAAARGLAVFPVTAGGKTVARPDWQQAATNDPGVVARTWRTGDNVGIGCWRSQVVGLDLDVRDDRDGRQVLAELAAGHGQELPSTLTVTTPSGGSHLYYGCPAGVVIGSYSGIRSPLGFGVDVRGPGAGGRGGYLVGPDSVGDGRRYVIDRDVPIAVLPAWLAGILVKPGPLALVRTR